MTTETVEVSALQNRIDDRPADTGAPTLDIHCGDVLERLRQIPDATVHMVVTSPPYWGLRDYDLDPVVWAPVRYCPMPGLPDHSVPSHADPDRFAAGCTHDWTEWQESHAEREARLAGKTRTSERYYGDDPTRRFDGNHQKHSHGQFCRLCGAWRGCLGLEPTADLYIGHLVQVARELRRVLRPDGTLWLNLGDSYVAGNQDRRASDKKSPARAVKVRPDIPVGLKPKDLVGVPWRAAFALQSDGWILRSDIVWAKTNPMPESVRDRLTRSHEMVFLLAPSKRYFYDHIGIREPHKAVSVARVKRGRSQSHKWWDGGPGKQSIGISSTRALHPDGRNKRDVWTFAVARCRKAHFATFPVALVEPAIKAGTPDGGVCAHCGRPARRTMAYVKGGDPPPSHRGSSFVRGKTRAAQEILRPVSRCARTTAVICQGWAPDCSCRAPLVPSTVLDPFAGSGTTAIVARRLGRSSILIEANPEYVAEFLQPLLTEYGAV